MGKSKKLVPDTPKVKLPKKRVKPARYMSDSEPVYRVGQSVTMPEDERNYLDYV